LRLVASVGALALALSGVATSTLVTTAALAAPGTPGTPQAASVVYQ